MTQAPAVWVEDRVATDDDHRVDWRRHIAFGIDLTSPKDASPHRHNEEIARSDVKGDAVDAERRLKALELLSAMMPVGSGPLPR